MTIDLSVSVDGYIAGPGDGSELPLGEGGQALFTWMGAGTEPMGEGGFLRPAAASRPVVEEWIAGAGAMISGRRTFDIAGGWADGHPIDAPIFVVTHDPPTEGRWSPRVTFVPEGVEAALAQAREVAGDGSVSACGASIAQQLLQLGVVDEIQLSVAPVLLGGGVRLLDHVAAPLEQVRVIVSDGVTHLRYRVVR
ncbi:MAG TPA: dihydrofolate reductase family protein [Iamia sp.]